MMSIFSLMLVGNIKYGFLLEYIRCEDIDGVMVFVSDIFKYNTKCDDEYKIKEEAIEKFMKKNQTVCIDYTIGTFMVEGYNDEQTVIEKWIDLRERDAIRVDYEWQTYCKDERK